MTLKTNQFNLTTKRYTQHDIEKMVQNKANMFGNEMSSNDH